jgi:5'-AMP-activated protein kinase catalytic alpha subunit
LKLGDFGLSNFILDGRCLQTSCGSANYAPPELLNGESYDGCAVDMWSCGVILYGSLMGALPFDHQSIPRLFKMIKLGKFYLPIHEDKMTSEARDLIVRLL